MFADFVKVVSELKFLADDLNITIEKVEESYEVCVCTISEEFQKI